MTGYFNVFKFLQLSVDGKHLTRFLSVFKFLLRNVDGTHVIEKRETASGRHTMNTANVGSTGDLIRQMDKNVKTNNNLQGWYYVKDVSRHQTWQEPTKPLDMVNGSLCNLCELALWLALHIFATKCRCFPRRTKKLFPVAILLYRFL